MPFYKKKPLVIDANQWDGTEDSAEKILYWVEANGGHAFFVPGADAGSWSMPPELIITTNEGDMRAKPGDFIIRGIKDEFYPCDENIFSCSYEPLIGSAAY